MTCQETSSPRTLVESAPFTPSSGFVSYLIARGDYSCAEIWFVVPPEGPPGWPPSVEFRIFGRVGEAKVLLRTVLLGDCRRTTNGSEVHGILASIRGWNVDAFEVEVESRAATTGQGRLIAKCWRDDAAPLIIAGAPGTHPIEQGAGLIAGGGTAGNPIGGVVSVQGPEAGGALPARPVRGGRFSSHVSTGRLSVATTPLTVGGNPAVASSLLMLRRGSKDLEVQRVSVSYHGNVANADGRVVLLRAVATISGGTGITPQRVNTLAPALSATAASGATFTGGSPVVLGTWVVRFNTVGELAFNTEALGEPIFLRNGELLAVQLVVDLAAAGNLFCAANAVFFEV